MIVEGESDTCLENLFEHNNAPHLRPRLSFKDLIQGIMELTNVGIIS
jgi:hypothetical protein